MSFRKSNGAPHVEAPRADELPAATPLDAAKKERDALGHFLPGNSSSKMRRAKTTIAGLRVDTSCDAYKPFGRWGRRYGAHRRTELARAHGGSISAGVGALVESAALALSAARFLHDKAASTGDASLFVTAARLATDARQHELAAWELGAREAESRRRSGHDTSAVLAAGLERVRQAREERARLAEEEHEPIVEAPAEREADDHVCTVCGSSWPLGRARCPSCGEADYGAS